MVGADLQGLIPPHHKSDLLALLMGKKPNIASTPLFPLIVNFGESEQLGPPTPSASLLNDAPGNRAQSPLVDSVTYILNRTSSSSS